LYSVQQYVRGLVDGLPVNATGQKLSAQITPPVFQKLDGPKAFVWGGRLRVDRQAGPRGKTPQQSGFKSLDWEITVDVVYLTNPTSPSSDEAFPQLLDTVMAAIWSSPVNLFIDQNGVPTGQTVNLPTATQLWNVGENFHMDYETVHTPQSQRMLYYSARLVFDVGEKVQA
jgi:hypothetical protein